MSKIFKREDQLSNPQPYTPIGYDFSGVLFDTIISQNYPRLITDDLIFKTDDGKFYIKVKIKRNNSYFAFIYQEFNNIKELLLFLNVDTSYDDYTEKEMGVKRLSTIRNNNTESILFWAAQTYNIQNKNSKIYSIEEAREKLFAGEINYYFDEDGEKHDIDIVSDRTIKTQLNNLQTTISPDNVPIPLSSKNINLERIEIPFSNITDGTNMFLGANMLTSISFNQNFPSLINGTRMFQDCSVLSETLDISNGSIVNVNNMFNGCSSIQKATLDCEKITNFEGAFANCKNIYSITLKNIISTKNTTGFISNSPRIQDLKFENTSVEKVISFYNVDPSQTIPNVSIINTTSKTLSDQQIKNLLTNYKISNQLSVSYNSDGYLLSGSTLFDKASLSNNGNDTTVSVTVNGTSVSVTKINENTSLDGVFKKVALKNIIFNSSFEQLITAKEAFPISLFNEETISKIAIALPNKVNDGEKHIITVGIDMTPKTYKDESEKNICGDFYWNDNEPLKYPFSSSLFLNNTGMREETPINTPFLFFVNLSQISSQDTPLITDQHINLSNIRLGKYINDGQEEQVILVDASSNNDLSKNLPEEDQKRIYVRLIETSCAVPQYQENGVFDIHYEPTVGENDIVTWCGLYSDFSPIMMNPQKIYDLYVEYMDEEEDIDVLSNVPIVGYEDGVITVKITKEEEGEEIEEEIELRKEITEDYPPTVCHSYLYEDELEPSQLSYYKEYIDPNGITENQFTNKGWTLDLRFNG